MKVSIIIPTYNEEKVIAKCLESLSKQTYNNYEIIVVDDGSADDSKTEIKNAESQFKIQNLSFFKQNHLGPGSARNLGARKARGAILVFVDADMTFESDFIEKLIKPITDKKSKGTFSKEEYVSNWDNVWSRCWNINQGWSEKQRHPKNYPNEQKVFRALLKSEFERVGGFDKGGHYTDDYLSHKLGYEAQSAKGAVFYHENPGNLKEVYAQSKWASKRRYKMGKWGVMYALLRSSLPVSIIIGLVNSGINFAPAFLIFKVVYDVGSIVGIIEFLLLGKQGR